MVLMWMHPLCTADISPLDRFTQMSLDQNNLRFQPKTLKFCKSTHMTKIRRMCK